MSERIPHGAGAGAASGNAVMKIRHRKGWRPDLPDKRDIYYHATAHFHRESKAPRPPQVDLSSGVHMPAIEDQGNLGSCTAFGSLAAYNYLHHMQTGEFMDCSHLFQYYNSRLLEGTTREDSGATIRDAVKAISKYGAATEKMMPYDVTKFRQHPHEMDYEFAQKHQALSYLRVETDAKKGGLTHLLISLAAGHPVIFGSTLFESFENPGPVAPEYIVPMPDVTHEQVLGGHCQLICGYNVNNRTFLVRNSWGDGWGKNGYEYLPFDYITDPDFTSDCWTLRKLEV